MILKIVVKESLLRRIEMFGNVLPVIVKLVDFVFVCIPELIATFVI